LISSCCFCVSLLSSSVFLFFLLLHLLIL
jgi:hypothetical protein